MHIGKILVLYNVKTKKEVLVVARNDSIPSDVSLPLDSIYSVCCSSDNKLALAEYPPIPKVVICQYPDLQVLTTLIGRCNIISMTYVSSVVEGFYRRRVP